jgi:hypothetical protein
LLTRVFPHRFNQVVLAYPSFQLAGIRELVNRSDELLIALW